ncbi:hypothetical protein Vadar_027305 [Vaccinium darrowii]|uniref:Uncharacterized protein n=1 Tax=Vaccinium darrowii TaxID=229202 RepID=A0ACB7XCS1_9ERIC|nr:hypothetical protein Vadar_027305 [Vaccinium darrowii]
MEKEPLLPYISPRRPQPSPPSPLCPLPENDEISLPLPLTPSELKERLIFGPSSPSSNDQSSSLVDALTLTVNSPRLLSTPSCSSSDSTTNSDPQNSQSWFNDPSYRWNKSNLHRSKTAPAMATINEVEHPSAVTMCTIGYGDITPNSTTTKLFSIMFVLVGFGFIDILLSGMVSYMLDVQENYLLRHVKVGADRDRPGSIMFDVKKGRMRIRMKVGLALGVVVLCIGIGAAVMHYVERLVWLDAFYLSVMSVTTVGYGDRAFTSMTGRLFASIWLLVSTLAVARAFLYLAEARVDKRHRKMAKWVLGQDMTVSQFLAADIDNNGFVSKSEYVIYKLKEMGKVSDKDIMQICKTFDRLDTGKGGKITLADLMKGHL